MQGVFVIVVLVVAVFSAIGGSFFQKQAFRRDAQSLAYYERTFLRKQGWTVVFGQYELLSFDGGREWYAVERDDHGAVIIRGAAEEVFPGFLGHVHSMDTLVAYAQENGPLTLSGERANTDRALLEAAGFTVGTR